MKALEDTLRSGNIPFEVFSGISPNPTVPDVTAGVVAYKAFGANAIVGIGGGSAMDGAKAIALMVEHPGDLVDYDERVGGFDRIGDHHVPPMFTVPTTAGTGSEVGRATVIVDPQKSEKMVIFHPVLMPLAAIVDPNLMTSLPKGLTAATGMDALTHNVEAYLAKGYHPMADGIALEGIRLCANSLEKAVQDGNDIQARSDMAAASMMGAVAFQKGLGVTHSLAHPLSSIAGMHHGLANGILLPYAMRFNGKAVPQRFIGLAEAVGRLRPGMTGIEATEAFLDWVIALRVAIGIPNRLSEAGVTEAQVEEMIPQAFADGCHGSNPVAVTEEDLANLYREAL